ncbi:hypothetical protein Tco_0280328 [Tanacetum coccineum]
MLKVSPWKGVVRFAKKGKLTPRYVGPFEILERIGPVAYRLRLPEEFSGVDKTLRFVEEPVRFMDREIKSLKHSKISLVKGGSLAVIHGLFSGWYCGLAGRMVTLRVSMSWAKGVTTGTLVRYETSCSRLPIICVIDWFCMLVGEYRDDKKDVRKSG